MWTQPDSDRSFLAINFTGSDNIKIIDHEKILKKISNKKTTKLELAIKKHKYTKVQTKAKLHELLINISAMSVHNII